MIFYLIAYFLIGFLLTKFFYNKSDDFINDVFKESHDSHDMTSNGYRFVLWATLVCWPIYWCVIILIVVIAICSWIFSRDILGRLTKLIAPRKGK